MVIVTSPNSNLQLSNSLSFGLQIHFYRIQADRPPNQLITCYQWRFNKASLNLINENSHLSQKMFEIFWLGDFFVVLLSLCTYRNFNFKYAQISSNTGSCFFERNILLSDSKHTNGHSDLYSCCSPDTLSTGLSRGVIIKYGRQGPDSYIVIDVRTIGLVICQIIYPPGSCVSHQSLKYLPKMRVRTVCGHGSCWLVPLINAGWTEQRPRLTMLMVPLSGIRSPASARRETKSLELN